MTASPQAPTRIDTTETEERGSRERRLREARRFRREQIASLEHELADDPRADTVSRVLLMAATTALAEVDAALDRMAHDAYGRCVTCGRQIPDTRLDVLPMTAQCMPCHFHDQNSGEPSRRSVPVEESHVRDHA